MTTTFRIAVDCDDVLVDFFPRVLAAHNKEFGTDLRPDDITTWDENPLKMSPHFGPGCMYATWWDWLRDRHWLWSTCDAVPGAVGGLSKLAAAGHHIELLTAKPAWAKREMTSWLAKWHPTFDQLTFVDLDGSKPEASQAMVLIDDRPQNVEEWCAAGRVAILFDRPWNREVSLAWHPLFGNATRAADWSEVLELMEILPAVWKERSRG